MDTFNRSGNFSFTQQIQHTQPVDLTNNMNMDNKQIAIKHAEHFIEAVKHDQELSAANHLILAEFALHGERKFYETVLTGYNEEQYLAEWEN